MPITTREVTTYICDRCGWKTENRHARARSCASSVFTYDYAEAGDKVSSWICGYCLADYREFMRGNALQALEKEP